MLTQARKYWLTSRSPFYAFVFVLPLVLIYEIAAFLLNRSDIAGLRNGADVLLKQLLGLLGIYGFYAYSFILFASLAAFLLHHYGKKGFHLQFRYLIFMLAESALYAVIFGFVVVRITNLLIQAPAYSTLRAQVVVALGAGVYEELLFRVLLIGGLLLLFRRIAALRPHTSLTIAVILSSLLFSASHYVGAFGEPFAAHSFVFRAVAGVILASLYLLRGFGITAYTHSLYDLLLLAGIIR